ncbi:hypothetical protein DESUT3_14300 [Desulfuromonas versatilis]|uniref:diguanylate cyclase n=1 Tax=Desulfuromonas versatilis TaxID=2802975 RepID=A0ABM8HUF6_9BACT|nr:diguanylate cyclase [Desulfuromonas versatilis]BCR04361.1 hypothetical protein DESUT3_14300 [Desulfuromonas versatilis]
MSLQILVVIKNPVSRNLINEILSHCGHDTLVLENREDALELTDTTPFPVVVTDIELETEAEVPFSALLQQHPGTQVIITGNRASSLTEAITTLRQGDYSYILKAFEDVGLVSATLTRAIDNIRVVIELRSKLEVLKKKQSELEGVQKTLQKIEVRHSLSGLYSKLHFHEILGRELIRSLQHNRPFSLLLMEIKARFLGEDANRLLTEEKLAQLAQAIKGRLRRSDLVTSYQERTFGILLPETTPDAANFVIRNLQSLTEQFPFGTPEERGKIQVLCNFGMASFPDDGAHSPSLLQKVEKNLLLEASRNDQPDLETNPKGPPPAREDNEPPADSRPRVLVVDDNEGILEVFREILEDEGYEVVTAGSGEQALALFETDPFPVVISDVIMPGMSGMDLLQRIKSLRQETEIVIMTSQSDLTPSIKALRQGAFDYLGKPFEDIEIIPLVVGRAFANFSRIRENRRLIEELERKNKGMAFANQTLQNLAIRDGLTNLYNHSYFKEALEIEVIRSRRYHRQCTVMFMDLDHFKNFNDSCGHLQGDKLLATLARMIGERLRKSDILARYGGEEFTAILPELSKEEAFKIAEDLRDMVESYPFPGREHQPGGRVTLSIGLASFPEDGGDASSLIMHADQALYRGKRQGRNRVAI